MNDVKDVVGMTIHLHSAQLLKNLQTSNYLDRMLQNLPPPPPPTRLERLQARIEEMQRRVRDAIKVLRGEADICDPYDC